MKNKNLVYIGIVVAVIFFVTYSFSSGPRIGPVGSVHEHADFNVYINGKALNFAQFEYMVKAREVHIENMIGDEIHKHATGVTLGHFFKTLGFEFNEKCFIMDNKEEFCNDGNKELKFYVNGQKNEEYGAYEIRDNDKYLISYGAESEEEIQKQISN